MCRKQRLLGVVKSECQNLLCSRVHILHVFFVSCANYYIIENRLFPVVAARQLMELRCSKFYESGTFLWAGQI